MKTILYSLAFLILAVSFSGCSNHVCPVPENIIHTQYIKRPMPKLLDRPIPTKYKTYMVQLNGVDYYVIPKADGYTLSVNWESYKVWAETNFNILKNLEK